MRKILFVISFLLIFLAIYISGYAQGDTSQSRRLIVFYSPTCHKCIQVKNEIIPHIEKQFKGDIFIEYRDITDIENYKLLLSLKEKYHAQHIKNVLPVFYFEGQFLNAQGKIKKPLESLITRELTLATKERPSLPRPSLESDIALKEGRGLPSIDLIARFKTLRPLAIISAGLIDGINPCAFTVMVFFISFLMVQGYRKRELIIVGLSFIFSIFLTYILIGIGIFGFLYRLKNLWLMAKVFNLTIGIFSIILGVLAVYDFFKFKKTRSTDKLLLQLPVAVKNQIHSIIAIHYRKSKGSQEPSRMLIFRLVLSALITGLLVSLLETVCTGQIYLPTISFVLKTTHLKLPALGYLLLYNLMFILPLLAIFFLSLWGLTAQQFAKVLKKHLLSIKILMAGLFFALGIFLILSLSGCNTLRGNPYLWDFGQVKEGEILKHNFILKNESQDVLNIKDVNTSCGCTVSKVEKKVLLPGESTLIEVEFDTKGYSGLTQQYIYVHTDNLDNPVLRFIIKAEAIKQK